MAEVDMLVTTLETEMPLNAGVDATRLTDIAYAFNGREITPELLKIAKTLWLRAYEYGKQEGANIIEAAVKDAIELTRTTR